MHIRDRGQSALEKKSIARPTSTIVELERTVLTLLNRPSLMRREYWQSEVERRLAGTDITVRDRQRLCELHDLLGNVAESGPTGRN